MRGQVGAAVCTEFGEAGVYCAIQVFEKPALQAAG
jgi:hypothetical protein